MIWRSTRRIVTLLDGPGTLSGLCALAVLMSPAACSRAATDAPMTPGGSTTVTITITPGGVTPKSVTIPLGARVVFINNDSRSHSIGSNPHPDHTDCPSINQAGFLLPGQTHETGNFVIARTCGFHDHDDPLNTSWWGTIATQ